MGILRRVTGVCGAMCGSWMRDGVTLTEGGGGVMHVVACRELYSNQLSGTVPTEVGGMAALQTL